MGLGRRAVITGEAAGLLNFDVRGERGLQHVRADTICTHKSIIQWYHAAAPNDDTDDY